MREEYVMGGVSKEFENWETKKSLKFFESKDLIFAAVQEKGLLVLGLEFIPKTKSLELLGDLGVAIAKMDITDEDKLGRGLAFVHEVLKEQERLEEDMRKKVLDSIKPKI